MTILALTPRREAGYPYDAYFAGGTLYLAPQFLQDFPQAEEALRLSLIHILAPSSLPVSEAKQQESPWTSSFKMFFTT